MKNKFLKMIASAFIMVMAFGLSNSGTENIQNTGRFLSGDNIAFADGYTCRPQAAYNCRIPGNVVIGYVADYSNSGGGGTN